jgi:hypothetical protein
VGPQSESSQLKKIADELRDTLVALASGPTGEEFNADVDVSESSAGSLRAVVVSDFFKGIGVTERQNIIWDHLKASMDHKQLVKVIAVHPYDRAEHSRWSLASSTTSEAFSHGLHRSMNFESSPEGDD